MKAHEILKELRANKTQFDSILSDASVQMGFECEMILDAEKSSGNDYEEDTPTIEINSSSWDEITPYLDISSRTQDKIDSRFTEWLSDKVYEAWENQKSDYIRKYCEVNDKFEESDAEAPEDETDDDREARHDQVMEDNENAAREDWEENERDSIEEDFTIDDWIDDVYGRNSRLINDLHISSEYGTDDNGDLYTEYHNGRDEDEGSSEEAHQEAAESLANHLDIGNIRVSSDYHSQTKSEKSWYIEPDSSITDNEGVPAEIVSCVYQVGEGLSKMKGVFDWMDENNHSTDKSTGLHINLSIKGKDASEYDFLKMMIFFDENYTANLFKRLSNTFASQMRNRILQTIASNHLFTTKPLNVRDVVVNNKIEDVLDVLKNIGKNLANVFGKYASIQNRGNGVFEFRGMGGVDYQNKYDVIRKQTVHMAYILKVGSDPNMLAKEYITKVFTMLDQGKYANAELGSGQAKTTPVSKEFSTFADYFAKNKKWATLSISHPNWSAIDFVIQVAYQVRHGEMQLSRLQKLQLKRSILRNKITPEKMRVLVNKETDDVDMVYNVIAQWMGWPLATEVHDARQEMMPFVTKGSAPPPRERNQRPDDIYEPSMHRYRQHALPYTSSEMYRTEPRYAGESVMLKKHLKTLIG